MEQQKLKLREQFFDFEVTPEWWCVSVGKYPEDGKCPESIKDDFITITSDDTGYTKLLQHYICDKDWVNIGYNNKGYDNIILNAVMRGLTPHQVWVVSQLIINPDLAYTTEEYATFAPWSHKKYVSPDFIYDDELDDNVGSLKDKEACMQLDIRESEIPFDKTNLTPAEKAEFILYNRHDVWSSMVFFDVILKPFIASKLAVGRVFNIPLDVCYKSTNAKLSAAALGAKKKSFPDANRQDIVIPKELEQYIRYNLPAAIVDRICRSPEKFDVELFGDTVSYSNGGIHSVPSKPKEVKKKDPWFVHVKSGNGWVLVNVDAGSFYPNLMVAWHGLSRAIPDPSMFAKLIKTRLELKALIGPFEDKYGKHPENAPKEEYDAYISAKEQSQAIKLILNTTYGASGNKYLELYDPYMTTYTCRLGQLVLTALANNLYTSIGARNIRIIQTNTDGILIYIKEEYLDMMYEIGHNWEAITHIPLEFENEYEIWQRDVNNYIMGKANGRVKTKGGFFVTDMQQPGYNRVRPLDNYVCREAMINFIAHGEDIVKHIYEETDLSKFVVTCNKGTASKIHRRMADGSIQPLHKCNRVYASLNKSLGEIQLTYRRLGIETLKKSPGCPPHCELINDALANYDFATLRDDIDYMWYINETCEMISAPWYEYHGADLIRYYPIPEEYII